MHTFAQKPVASSNIFIKSTNPGRGHFGYRYEENSSLSLQRMLGNQTMLAMLQPPMEDTNIGLAPRAGMIQTKLTINQPGDEYEQEADRISEQIMRMPEPGLQRACACGGACAERQTEKLDEEDGHLQRIHTGNGDIGGAVAPPIIGEVLSAPGYPLDPLTRGIMEPRFGYDLSHVRIHTDGKAAESARAVRAQAYTVGNEVVFGEGEYSPRTPAGQTLLAHELVHTLQQSRSAGVVHRQTMLDIALRSRGVAAQLRGSDILDGFELNSYTLTAEHKQQLIDEVKTLKELLREHPLGTIEIIGHTDATGGEAFNQGLGQNRADAVADFLGRVGIPAMAVLTQSAGESALLVPTFKPEPRNRRVEIHFLPQLSIPKSGSNPPEKQPDVPRPENYCEKYPERCEQIATNPEVMPNCHSDNCSAYGNSFEKLPPDLKLVLVKSFKGKAPEWFEHEPERGALTQIFNRLCQYGVWCHVRIVLKIHAAEAPVLTADNIYKVPGRTASVYFTSPSGDTLIEALMATGRFCKAYGAGASQHPGQTTLREISGSDSLHVSVGRDGRFDAHIDKYSPVPEHPDGSFCSNAATPASVGHISRELFPEKVREILGLPGFQVFPDPGPSAPVPPGTVGPDPFRTSPGFSLGGSINLLLSALLESSRVTVYGPLPKRPEPLVPAEFKRPSPGVAELKENVITPMERELAQKVSADALLPSGVQVKRETQRTLREFAGPDEEGKYVKALEEAEAEASIYADAYQLGLNLAARMENARINNDSTVRLPLGWAYGGLDERDRKFIAGEIRRIALIVRKHLPNHATGVTHVIVLFGVVNNVKSEVIDLPES